MYKLWGERRESYLTKKSRCHLADVAQWLSAHPWIKRSPVWFSVRANLQVISTISGTGRIQDKALKIWDRVPTSFLPAINHHIPGNKGVQWSTSIHCWRKYISTQPFISCLTTTINTKNRYSFIALRSLLWNLYYRNKGIST